MVDPTRPTSNWANRTAIFGGRFDPPHLGHKEAVLSLFSNPGVGRVLIVPTACPPHKPASATAVERAEMAELCFNLGITSHAADITLELCELRAFEANPEKPSYSFHTIQYLSSQHHSDLAFVIGTDQLFQLNTWFRFPELLGLCHWIVIDRKSPAPQKAALKAEQILEAWKSSGILNSRINERTWTVSRSTPSHIPPKEIIVVPTEAPAISSTEIRESIARTPVTQDWEPKVSSYLASSVLSYLKKHKLYGIT